MSDNGLNLSVKEIIRKKRDGKTLSAKEWDFIIRAISRREIEGEQIGAFLMAIYLNGLEVEETTELTKCMLQSGESLTWPEEWKGLVVDKHSTGGVGDKVSLVLAPALAACGLKVPMISGRALGHTGGTLDKLEAIPGFEVSQSAHNIRKLMDEVGCCIVGQTKNIVPADRVLYSSRDVTMTVGSLPLIVSSIVSKKAAENLSSLVLDVKFGSAAFMKDKKDAEALARSMVDVSNGLGIKTAAVLTSMDNPLGYHVGNGLEVYEALRCMHGEGPADLEDLVAIEGAILLQSAGLATDVDSAKTMIRDVIHDGRALAKFRQMAVGQGVAEEAAKILCTKGREYEVLRKAAHTTEVRAKTSGHVHVIEPMPIAMVSGGLGGARHSHADKMNHSVGVVLACRAGQRVESGDLLVTLHHDESPVDQSFLDQISVAVDIRPHSPATEFVRFDKIID